MAVLLGSATATINLDIGQFMANARTAEGAMNELASAGTGTRGPNFLDRLGTSALGLGTALIVPMGLGLKAAVDLEQQMANVDAALGDISDNDLSALADQFNEIAAASQFSAVEIGGVGEELAKAGVAREDLAATTQAVVDLSQATGEDLFTSLSAVSTATAIWSDGMVSTENVLTDVTDTSDILTNVLNQTRASMTDINAGMRNFAPSAARAGLSFSEMAAALGFFVDLGLPGAEAGTSLTAALTNLADPTSDATAYLNELGIAAFDLEGNFIGFPALFDQLQTSLSGFTQQEQEMILSTIFGREAIDVMGLAALTGGDRLRALEAAALETGTAAEQSAIRMDTLGAQFGTLKEGINTFLGSLVSGLIPGLRIFVDMANQVIDVLMAIPAPIKTIIGTIAGLLAGFASIAAAIRTFQALNVLLGGMGLASGGLAASLGAVLTPLLLIGAVVGGLYLAWRTNFLGMQGIVTRFTSGLRRFGRSFSDTFRNLTTATYRWGDTVEDIVPTMARFPAFFIAFGNALGTIGGGLPILSDLGRGIVDLGFNIIHLGEAFNFFRSIGLDPVQAGLRALGIMFPEISGFTNEMQIAIGRLTEAFLAFAAGDFGRAFGLIRDVAVDAIGAISNVIGSVVDWTLNVAAPAVVNLTWDAIGAITPLFAGMIVSLTEWIAQLDGAEVVGGALDLAGGIADWITANPIPTVLIGAGVLSLLFFGLPGTVAIALVGLVALLALAVTAEVPKDMILPITDLVITISAFTVEFENFLAEAYIALGLEIAKLEADAGDLLSVIKLATPKIDIDWAGALKGIGLGFQSALTAVLGPGSDIDNAITSAVNAFPGLVVTAFGAVFGPGGPVDSAINGAINGLIGVVAAAIKPFADSLKKTWSDITGAFDDLEMPEINWPDAPGVWEVPLLADVISLFGDLVSEIESAWDRVANINLNPLDIDWSGLLPEPSFPAWLTSPPQWWTNIQAGRMPWDNGGGGGEMSMDISNIPGSQQPGAGIPPFTDPATNPDDYIDPGTTAASSWANLAEQITKARISAELASGPFATLGTSVSTSMSGLEASVSGSMNTLIASMTNGAATAVTATEAIFATLGTSIAASLAGVQAEVQGAMNGVVAAMANGGATATQALQNALSPLPGIVQTIGSRAAAAATLGGLQIAQGFRNGSALAPAMVAAALASIPGIISGVGGRASAAALAVGLNIGRAMAAGILAGIPAVRSAAAALSAAATVTVSKQLVIRSPSKVFMQLGEYVSEGFALGIRSGIPLATSAASDLAYIPNVTPGQYAGNAYATTAGAAAGGNVTYAVNITVEGNVTTENDLKTSLVQAITRVGHDRNTAIGVTR